MVIFFNLGGMTFKVKIKDFRVKLEEIKYHVQNLKNIGNVFALPTQNKLGTTQLHLFLENYTGDFKEIGDYLATKIPVYMIPSSMSSIQLFPLNKNGKIDRKKLYELLTS